MISARTAGSRSYPSWVGPKDTKPSVTLGRVEYPKPGRAQRHPTFPQRTQTPPTSIQLEARDIDRRRPICPIDPPGPSTVERSETRRSSRPSLLGIAALDPAYGLLVAPCRFVGWVSFLNPPMNSKHSPLECGLPLSGCSGAAAGHQ